MNNPKFRRGLTPERNGIWGPRGPYEPTECTGAWLPALKVRPAIPNSGLASARPVESGSGGGALNWPRGGGIYPLSISYGSRHYLLR